MIKENASRKIDSLGRISIPKNIRDRFEIQAGDDLEFFTTIDGMICLRKLGQEEQTEKYRIAASVLMELGYDLPAELKQQQKKIDEER